MRFRRFRQSDAEAIARLYRARYGGFFGLIEVTAESWSAMYAKGWWNCPSLEKDPDCVQVAEAGREIVGYVAFHHDASRMSGDACIQELVARPAADGGPDRRLEEMLLARAEKIVAERGALRVVTHCSEKDAPLWSLLDRAGYGGQMREFTVFMLAVIDLPALLERMAPVLAERASASGVGPPLPSVTLKSPSHRATIVFRRGGGGVSVRKGAGGGVVFELTDDALVGLVSGSLRPEEAYLDGSLGVREAGPLKERAVELLGELFPRVPHAMLRAHSW